MVKLNKIYTRTGDSGSTGLADGSRLEKHHIRIEAYGTVDEANAILGIALLSLDAAFQPMLTRIQHDLFDLGADLSTPIAENETPDSALRIVDAQIQRLEQEIDQMNESLTPLTSFILPGGSHSASYLHLARTVVRRAERLAFQCAEVVDINDKALQYLNRLSDHLFVLARLCNASEHGDVLWKPGKIEPKTEQPYENLICPPEHAGAV